jgi:hypothetical protein
MYKNWIAQVKKSVFTGVAGVLRLAALLSSAMAQSPPDRRPGAQRRQLIRNQPISFDRRSVRMIGWFLSNAQRRHRMPARRRW